MGARPASLLAWSLLGLSLALATAGVALNIAGHPASRDLDYGPVFAVTFLGFSLVGAYVASRLPGNPIGWLLLSQGLCWELSGALAGYANYVVFARPGFLAGGVVAAWALNWLYIPAIAAALLGLLLFPDGRLPSARWRSVPWILAAACVLSLVPTMIAAGRMANAEPLSNPFGIGASPGVLRAVLTAGTLLFPLAGAASVACLVVRFRRAGGPARHQLKWLAFATCLVFVAFTAYNILRATGLSGLAENIGPPSLLAIPVAVGIAILRYHLYDIDIVISKTLVFGGLATFITAVYLAMVAGVGAAVGSGTGSNLALAVVATAVVAVAFQPVRDRSATRGPPAGLRTPDRCRAGVRRGHPLAGRVPCLPQRRAGAAHRVAVKEGADLAEDPRRPPGAPGHPRVPDGRAVAGRESRRRHAAAVRCLVHGASSAGP